MKRLASSIAAAALLVTGTGVVMATPASATTVINADIRSRLLDKHNAARKAKCGSDHLLHLHGGLNTAAQEWTDLMFDKNILAHDIGSKHWYQSMEREANFEYEGQNIARGQDSVNQVFSEWMASPGHKANILDCKFKYVGFGYEASGSKIYWTADFGANA